MQTKIANPYVYKKKLKALHKTVIPTDTSLVVSETETTHFLELTEPEITAT